MLLVKTKLSLSTIPKAGIGLFACEYIPSGTIIWKFVPDFDLILTRKQILNLPEVGQIFLATSGGWKSSLSTDTYIVCLDNGRFFNHSLTPNTGGIEKGVSHALRDITSGEELTESYIEGDYLNHKDDILLAILKKHNLDIFLED